MSESMARTRKPDRYPGEMSEGDLDILGPHDVRINIPFKSVPETLAALRAFYRVAEGAIYVLENAKMADDRHAMFDAKMRLRSCAMSISKVKRRRL